jgi:hypothetical protein
MSIKYTNIFHCKTLKKLCTQIWIFGLKIYHLATPVQIMNTKEFERAFLACKEMPTSTHVRIKIKRKDFVTFCYNPAT